MVKKLMAIFAFFTMVFIQNAYADHGISFTLEITGLRINSGNIHVKIYSNERDYKRDVPYISFDLKNASEKIIHSFEIIEGDYLIAIFQDTNNNGRLDTNLFGVPTEPVGLSNYRGGIPGGFNKQKISINNNLNRITINVGRL